MPDAAEFTDPVGYPGWWLVVCVLLVVAVAAYYYAVLRWAAAGELPETTEATDSVVEPARKACAARLAALERGVASGTIPVRRGYQELSAAVRGFVEEVGATPARSMTLEELRDAGQPRVAEAIAVIYPGEFAPEDAGADDFREVVQQARELVVSWS